MLASKFLYTTICVLKFTFFSRSAHFISYIDLRAPAIRKDGQNTARLASDVSNTCRNTQTNLIYLKARSLKSVTSDVNKIRDFNALIGLGDSDIFWNNRRG